VPPGALYVDCAQNRHACPPHCRQRTGLGAAIAITARDICGRELGRLGRRADRAECCARQRLDFRSRPSASAFLTSDCEIPNCRAIAEGLTPALKAARTAFSLPVVNEPVPCLAGAWRGCGLASAVGFSFARLGGSRPRRSASVVTAANRASISALSNRLSAPAMSLGKKMARLRSQAAGLRGQGLGRPCRKQVWYGVCRTPGWHDANYAAGI
jgi:hypothetical protein